VDILQPVFQKTIADIFSQFIIPRRACLVGLFGEIQEMGAELLARGDGEDELLRFELGLERRAQKTGNFQRLLNGRGTAGGKEDQTSKDEPLIDPGKNAAFREN
jgi:hypothetical protein